MKYFLVLALEFKAYKKPAAVKISMGDRLIDLLHLDKDLGQTNELLATIKEKHYVNYNSLKLITDAKKKDLWTKQPKFFKVYEIESSHIKDLNIEVVNENSDFNNGFMKHSSMIRFPCIALFPKTPVVEDDGKMFKFLVMCEKLYLKYGKELSLTSAARQSWPSCDQYYVSFKNKNQDMNKNGLMWYNSWIGSSFDIKIEIGKKHGMFYLKKHGDPAPGLWIVDRVINYALCTSRPLLNIYNENTGSNTAQNQ